MKKFMNNLPILCEVVAVICGVFGWALGLSVCLEKTATLAVYLDLSCFLFFYIAFHAKGSFKPYGLHDDEMTMAVDYHDGITYNASGIRKDLRVVRLEGEEMARKLNKHWKNTIEKNLDSE